MGPRAVRKNGFQLPRSGDQKTVMVIYPLVTAIFDGLLIWLEHNDVVTLLALLLPHLVMVVIVISNWYAVESINPEDKTSTPTGKQLKSGIRVVCFDQSLITTRYCASCRKQVYGLDHHCTWLNTCVGARNYVYFFALIVTGTCQMLYQTLLGVLYMTLWRKDSSIVPERGDNLIVFFSLVSFFCLMSFLLTIAFGVLMVFHLYLLLWIRAGTYDWMMGNKGGSSSRAQARAQKRVYETAHMKQTTVGSSGTDVRHGFITPTGDIEFTTIGNTSIKQDSNSSLGAEHEIQSASGDEISNSNSISNRSNSRSRSSSLASSRATEELIDPDRSAKHEQRDAVADANGNSIKDEELALNRPPTPTDDCDAGEEDHDPNVPTRDLTSLEIMPSEDISFEKNADVENI